METGRLRKQNLTDIRRQVLFFIAHFIILSALSFTVVYLFFETYAIQSNNINNDIIAYKQILNKQQVLKAQIDTIYNQMNLLNTGVDNDDIAESYIIQEIADARRTIGKDSISDFKQYSILLGNVDTMMLLKDSITGITSRQQLALEELNECSNSTSRINDQNSQLLRNSNR